MLAIANNSQSSFQFTLNITVLHDNLTDTASSGQKAKRKYGWAPEEHNFYYVLACLFLPLSFFASLYFDWKVNEVKIAKGLLDPEVTKILKTPNSNRHLTQEVDIS